MGCGEGSSEGVLFGEYEESVHSMDAASTSVSVSSTNYRNIRWQQLNEESSDQELEYEEGAGNGLQRMRLMDDSDEEDSESSSLEIEDGGSSRTQHCDQGNRGKNKRSLKISRRVMFRKHKLLSIQEENSHEDWSPFSPL